VLMWGATNDRGEAIVPLLGHTSLVNAREGEGETALMIASWYGCTSAVKALLKKGADVNATTNESAYYHPGNSTALMFAAAEAHTETVKVLLANGANAETKNKARETALLLARRAESKEIARILVRARTRE
jgi:ankyrin repeat protein